jgi:hypothetical protein
MFSAGFAKSDYKSLRRLAAMAGGKLRGCRNSLTMLLMTTFAGGLHCSEAVIF